MSTSGKQLRCVVVTPEKAVLDQAADLVNLPMTDGDLGVLPGRLSLIGSMAPGVLRLKTGNQTKRLFVDGGFVQVKGDTVTILTPRAQVGNEVDVEAARNSLSAPKPKEAGGKVLQEHHNTIMRARALLKAAQSH